MLSGKTLVILDEAIWGGMKKDKSSIKTLITEPTVPIRLMRTDAYQEDSYHNIMAFSNEKNFWPTEHGARRDFLLECDNKWAGEQTDESKAYFDKIIAVDPAKYAHFLYNRDISEFNVRKVPITDLQREQAADNLDTVDAWLRSHMEAGDFYDEMEGKSYGFNAWILKETMYSMYKKEMEGGHSRALCQTKFWESLGYIFEGPLEYKREEWKDEKRSKNSGPRKIQIIPKLEALVAHWNKKNNDNIKTVKIRVDEEPEEPIVEEPNPLDDGIVV